MILVTGGTGFIGSYILRQLVAKGKKVRAIRRKTSPMVLLEDIADKIEWYEADILDLAALEDAFKDVTHVYHVAAVISFIPNEAAWMHKINVEGTANIVNLCLEFKVKKLLHVSSVAAIGRSETDIHINEETKWKQSKLNSNYGKSKFKAECEVWRGIEEGLTAAIVNPVIVLGAGIWDNGSCKLFKRVDQGLNYYPQGTNGFVDVRDVARASILLMESDVSHERFVLCSESQSFHQFLTTTAKYLGKPAPKYKVSSGILMAISKLDWLKAKLSGGQPLITKEIIRNTSHTNYYDGSKITRFISFTYTPIEKAIEETCKVVIDCRGSKQSYGVMG